jgi:TM2 domain-containing membrane protein YozV
MNRKSAELAAILSFFIPGLGQVYNGEFVKAFMFVLGAMLGAALCELLIGFFIALPIWVWAVVDAYYSAELHNVERQRRIRYEKSERGAAAAA